MSETPAPTPEDLSDSRSCTDHCLVGVGHCSGCHEDDHSERDEIFRLQDDILIGITDGRCEEATMRKLPPWRAVMFARVAYKAGVMRRAALDKLVREASLVGGNGKLRQL